MPVSVDVARGRLLLALSNAADFQVPKAPIGGDSEAVLEVANNDGESSQDRVLFAVVDKDFLASGRLLLLRESEEGEKPPAYQLFGVEGDSVVGAGELVAATGVLASLPGEMGEEDPGYLSAVSLPAENLLPPRGRGGPPRGAVPRVPAMAGRGGRAGAGRGKPTVAGLAEQVAVAMDRLAAQEDRLSRLQPLDGDAFDEDVEEEAAGSLMFAGARDRAPDLQGLAAQAGMPPVRRVPLGEAFAHVPGSAPEACAPPPQKGEAPRASGAPRAEPPLLRSKAPSPAPPSHNDDNVLRDAVLALVKSQQAFMDRSQEPLRALARDGGDGDGALKLPGAKGAAALELFRNDLSENPGQ